MFTTHYAAGTWTKCGLVGWQHRALAVTREPKRVTCKRCLKAMGEYAPRLDAI